MALFRKGLKENVKNKLMRTETTLSILDILIKITIAIDDKLHFRVMKKNPERHRQNRAEYASVASFYRRNDSYLQRDPMMLDSMKKVRTRGKQNKSR